MSLGIGPADALLGKGPLPGEEQIRELARKQDDSRWVEDIVARVTSAVIDRLSTRDLALGQWQLSLDQDTEQGHDNMIITGITSLPDHTIGQHIRPTQFELDIAIQCRVVRHG